MLPSLDQIAALLADAQTPAWLHNTILFVKVAIGFSIIIFVHELGHFLAAKCVGIRVDRFAVGFGPRVLGWRRGKGLTFGNEPEYNAQQLQELGYGETDYCLKALPFGGYVKMLGQEDVIVDEQTGEMTLTDDPRAFPSKSVGARMLVVSAGVIFNLLFAGVLLIAVFMIGQEQTAPVIGRVLPDSPARGLLQAGDRVLEINGHTIDSFTDVQMQIVLGEEVAHFKVQRDGRVLELDVPTARDEERGIRMLYVEPPITTRVARAPRALPGLEGLQAGDVIVAIDGRPVKSGFEIEEAFAHSRGRLLKLTVRRPDPQNPQQYREVECYQRAQLVVMPATPSWQRGQRHIVDDTHILGLLRRRAIDLVEPGSPADRAGFKLGDVIIAWGGTPNPTYAEIVENIYNNADRPVKVVVLRNGQEVPLTVVPRRPFKLLGEARPRVGLAFSVSGEVAPPVVADVVPDTPFAKLNLPRGAVLTSLDGKPVDDWFDVVNVLEACAGRTITVGYRVGEEELSGAVSVPGSLVDALDLEPGAVVWAIDGDKTVEVETPKGTVRLLLSADPLAVREALRRHIGRTVKVRYSRWRGNDPQEGEFAVREDNYDPWQMRIHYYFDRSVLEPQTVLVSAGGNPIRALQLSARYVVRQTTQVYMFMSGIAKRNVSARNVSGPVGIFKIAIQQAEVGLVELLFFLAFLSVNLAVINFLPMPVMDGGLMLFLIIEKIKGKPLSIKTQMISTMVSLALIVLVFLLVTVQDISRLF